MAATKTVKSLLLLLNCIALVAHAGISLPVGELDERGLVLHEAWTEASLSMDPARLDREWSRLLNHFQVSLRGHARLKVTKGIADWSVELRPLTGAMMVRVDRKGSRVVALGSLRTDGTRTLLSIYPWRRHYDCDGQALNPTRPGVPIRGKVCVPHAGMQWLEVAQPASEDDGAVVQRVNGLRGGYRVISEKGGLLVPGQLLAEWAGGRYTVLPTQDDTLRVRYMENRRLFVMSEKQRLGIVVRR